MRPRARTALLAAAIAGIGLAAFFLLSGRRVEARYATATVDRGDIADVVGATGTLQAVTTVLVGSQVSGTVASLSADFNSRVTKGQVVARLDPSLFEARLSQARANLVAARAGVERARATVEDTRSKYQRARELAAENLLPAADLDTAKANHDSAVAQVRGAEAAVSQAAAAVRQAEVDLGHTVIRAPIDGVVVARSVDVGQTVAASLQAPTIFVIAQDLSQMQVNASIDEADIGRVRVGQEVEFRVDAYPNETFTGRVEQVRLQPITVQNVVTYNTIIAVDNPGQRLMPGMTATVSLVVNRRDNVLRIPAGALRFRPEGWDPRSVRRGEGATAASGVPPERSSAAPGGAPAPASGARGEGGERRGFGARRAGRGGPGGAMGGGAPRFAQGPSATGAPPAAGSEAAPAPRERSSRPTVIFVPGPDGKPQSRPVRTGLSDGQFVEIVEGLGEGDVVITGVASEAGRGPAGRPSGSPANPFGPQPPQRRQR